MSSSSPQSRGPSAGIDRLADPSPNRLLPRPSGTIRRLLIGGGHAARGALIGLVELVPGVSGGTVALVLGVYDRLVMSAHYLLHGVTRLVRRRATTNSTHRARTGARSPFAGVEWWLILPLAAGLLMALFTLADPLHSFVETQPVVSSALFLGMVTASLLVPITMVRDAAPPTHDRTIRSRLRGPAVVLIVAAVAFLLLRLPPLAIGQPPAWVIVLSGAAAVCALALPGLSGSFVLLTLGLYEPTLEAVTTRNISYLGLFVAGAALGLVSVVQLLTYLLRAHRRAVLLIATGLILGSLRALWPWQDDSMLLPPPEQEWADAVLAFVAGAGMVLLLWWVDRRRSISARTPEVQVLTRDESCVLPPRGTGA